MMKVKKMKQKRLVAFVLATLLAVAPLAGTGCGLVKAEGELKATGLLVNGNFETGDESGWTVSFDSWENKSGYKVEPNEWMSNNKTNFINIYNGLETTNKFKLSQTVTAKAGNYKVSLDLEGAEAENGLHIYAYTYKDDVTTNLTDKALPATTGWDNWQTIETGVFELTEDGDFTIEISGDVPAKYWGDIDNVILYSDAYPSDDSQGGTDDSVTPGENNPVDTTVEAKINVTKNDMVTEDFITGFDVSSYVSQKNSGVKYYDFDGKELATDDEYFAFLKSCGVNYIRVRVWNNPYDASGNGYGGGNNDMEAALRIGKAATNAGQKLLVDFHYSDFWADPGKQKAPKAYSSLTVDEKAEKVAEFTTECLTKLKRAGVDVGMVQIGNETNNGVCGESGWTNMSKIFSAGSRATRAVDPGILIAVHFANPEKSSNYAAYAKNLNDNNVDYDVFASSYYPYWHGTTANLTSVLKNVAETYGKKVMVAETSWAYTLRDGDGWENTVRIGNNDKNQPYNFSVQGQANELSAVAKAVTDVGEAGIGMFYWEAAWTPVNYAFDENGDVNEEILTANKAAWEKYGSGWASSYATEYDPVDAGKWFGGSAVDNQALFDFNGKALPSIMTYSYLRTGARADYSADEDPWLEELPAEEEVVLPDNLLKNPGFEEKDSEAWKVEITAGGDTKEIGIKNDSSNVKNGDHCLKFWYGSDFAFTATQEVAGLEPGKYTLFANLQGGDANENSSFVLFAQSGSKELTASSTLQGWQVWDTPTITDIEVGADGKLTVGCRVEGNAGAWGAWDDFYLYKQAEETTTPEATGTTPSTPATTGGSTGSSTSDNVITVTVNDANETAARPARRGTQTTANTANEAASTAADTTENLLTADAPVQTTDKAATSASSEVSIEEEAAPAAAEAVEKTTGSSVVIICVIAAVCILAAAGILSYLGFAKKAVK